MQFVKMRCVRIALVFLIALMGVTAAAAAERAQGQAESGHLEGHSVPGVFIDPELKNAFARSGNADLLVYLRDKADLSAAHGMSWDERGWYVYETLSAHAELTQAHVRRHLDESAASYRSFWIENAIYVEAAPIGLLNSLANLPGLDAIISPPVGYIPEPEDRPEDNNVMAPISSIAQIGAPDVWALGFRGQGSVVGIIDSGTRHTHVALVNQYRGNQGGGAFDHNYNWFDVGGAATPQFPNPHGTHVTGTAIGDDGAGNQIGVAPEAQWVSCLGCTSSGCPALNLLSCAQFMAAPTDLAGNNPDPGRRPDVVNNSWGSCTQSYDPWYQGVVDAWVAAGVVPVFSNGNAGNCGYSSPPGLNTAGNPGRYASVLGIGSSGNSNGQYASHSNWGPTDNPNDGSNPLLPDPMGHGELKPNVIAPGVSIFSSVSSSDTAFQSGGWTGTSMSAPAVSGLVALMWEAAPVLRGDYATTGTLIMQTANPIPYDSGGPNVGPGNVPNHATGWGEINALAAVLAALEFSGPRGTVTGQVTDLGTGEPIAGALVFVENDDPEGMPASWSTTTDPSGNYSLTLAEGARDFEFSAFGYLPATEADVIIVEDETTVVNVQLQAAASVEIAGSVVDSNTGWPLHARISIAGFPDSPIYTDPADGSYDLALPVGTSYDFDVYVLSGGYVSDSRSVDTSAGVNLTEDFAMDADLLACTAPGYNDQAPVAYFEDFEFGNGGFVETVATGTAMWEHGTPVTWPGSCAEGSNCWGTNLGGLYPNSSQAWVTSPLIDLAGVAPPVTLQWQQANHLETFQWDKGYVEISIDGGPWTILWQNPATTTQTGWRQLSQDISGAAGETIQLRWRLQSDSSVNFNGLYFDLIRIQGAPECVARSGELVSGRVVDANTGDALIGAEVAVDGFEVATTGVSEDPALGEGAYLAFVPEGNRTLAASFAGYETGELVDDFVDAQARRVDFALNAGRLTAVPEAVTQTVVFGETDSSFLVLVNDGTAEANISAEAIQLVRQDFETAFPPAGWAVENLGGTCVWARNDAVGQPNYAGGDGFSAAADSDDCGQATTMDTALISPPLIASATSTLDFVLSFRPLGSSRLDVDVSVAGGIWTSLATYNTAQSPQGPGTPISLSLAAYADDEIQVRFRYVAGWDWWAQVDQIAITGQVDWLNVDPGLGVLGLTSLPLTLSYDAGAPSITAPGEYEAFVLIENDTPYGSLTVPVTMLVEPSVNQAQITGQVSGLGHCDNDPAPAPGATVEVIGQQNTYSLTSDANGMYALWMSLDETPLTIEVSAPDHVSDSVSGVGLVSQQTTVQDFDLRLDAACGGVAPESIMASMLPGESESFELTLSNDGAGQMDWSTAAVGEVTSVGRERPASPTPTASGNSPFTSDLRSLLGDEPIAGGLLPLGAFDCSNAPGMVIHDDGVAENGISGNPATISQAIFTSFYEPADYPSLLSRVCFFLISQGPTTVNVNVVVYEADGPGGQPGTLLASVPTTVTSVPGGLTPTVWANADLSGEGLQIESGGVYVGLEFTPTSPNFFVATDESTTTPLQTSYWFNNSANEWAPTQGGWPAFRALMIRPQMQSGCASGDPVSWIDVQPVSGSTNADSSSTLDLTIDTSGLVPGEYEALVCIDTNDPVNRTLSVPVSVTVGAAAGTGILEGSIQSLGYCSENPAPAGGAAIEIQGQLNTYNLTADANGLFSLVLDMSESPMSLIANAPDHLEGMLLDIELVEQDVTNVDLDLVLEAACASAMPAAFELTMADNAVASEVMTLINEGALAYAWSIDLEEVDTVFGKGSVDVVADGGFEGGTPNSSWDESSTNFGTPLCDAGCVPPGGTAAPRSGSWWTWFGGIESAESASVSQLVTIPVGSSAELRFFLEIPAAGQPGVMDVSLDGDVLFTVTEADAGSYPTYQEVILDVSGYADGGSYVLEFSSTTQTAAEVTNFFVDDVSLVVQPGALACADPLGVSWLFVDAVSGMVEANASELVELTFDSAGLNGLYQANICVSTADSENALIVIPVSLNVVEDNVFQDRFEDDGAVNVGDRGDARRKIPD